jgi:outer membrane protein assembly factor BamB
MNARDVIQDRIAAQLIPLRARDGEAQPVELELVANPIADRTLGGFDIAVSVESLPSQPALLRIPIPEPLSVGIAAESVRMFRVRDGGPAEPIWTSGYTAGIRFAWATIEQPGTYVPIGLPRDRLVEDLLRQVAVDRRLGKGGEGRRERKDGLGALAPLLDGKPEDVAELRRFLTQLEIQTGTMLPRPDVMERGTGGHLWAYPLPGGGGLDGFRERLKGLRIPDAGLPEEALFFPPEPALATPPWSLSPDHLDWDGLEPDTIRPIESIIDRLRPIDLLHPFPWFPWLWSKNWWMHQHDRRHTGHASGPSDITSVNVNRMIRHKTLPADGPVITKPSIVDGEIFFGSGRQGGSGGTFYKYDLVSGTKLGEFPTSGIAFYSWVSGVGGSPAVTGGRAYFTGVHGKVYCVDTSTMTPSPPHPPALWETDLSIASLSKNQPVNQPNADSWSGPLVVGDRVYVGCGEGEDPNTYGFVYCLDADTGRVNWLFCTAKFGGVANNSPNVIPGSVAAWWAGLAGFSVTANAPETGSAVWSSCAYDRVLDRIYVGTGNSEYNWAGADSGTDQPDDLYGSGLISLDATTGAFKAFFQPTREDSYWPGDYDIDVPGAPTVVVRGKDRVVAFGSKNGSFFLLDPNTLAPVARRQMLPRAGGTGVPGNRGTGVPGVVPTGGSGENMYGIFGTPAVHPATGKLFIGIGGYNGMALDGGAGIDATSTPFVRAVDWKTLLDAWPTSVGPDGISRYTTARPPLYQTGEVGLSSPAVVNDVVFVSTDKAAMYAFDVDDGQCLWQATDLPNTGSMTFALGPAIYGNYVALGAGADVYVYRLGWRLPWPWPGPRIEIPPIIRYPWPWPPPPPDPWPRPDPVLGRPATAITPQLAGLLVIAVIVAIALVAVALVALAVR